MSTCKAKPAEQPHEVVIAYKGFDKNLRCRDFQYEVGKTYTHKGDAPPFTLPPEPPQSRAWDHPLTPTVMCVLAFAVAFVAVLAVAGWLA